MSRYRYLSNPDDGSGAYVDTISGERFPHDGGKHRAFAKTAAKQAMLVKQDAILRAADARPKTEKPWYPPQVANIIGKSRSERRQEIEHIGRAPAPAADAADTRLAYHQKALDNAKTSDDRARALRRLRAAETAKERGIARQSARDARQAQIDDPQLQASIDLANAVYQDLLVRESVPEVLVKEAKTNLNDLRHSRDYKAWEVKQKQLESRFELDRNLKVENAKRVLADAKALVAVAKTTPDLFTPETVANDATE